MKNIYILCLLACIFFISTASSGQDLNLGVIDSNEVLVIDNQTQVYNMVRLFNNSSLTISNSNITVNTGLITLGTSNLNIINSTFTVYGICYFIQNSIISIKDTVSFNCHISIQNQSHFIIDSGYFYMNMDYFYQYYLYVMDSAEFSMTNSTFFLKDGKLGGIFFEQTNSFLNNMNFLSPVTFIYEDESQAELTNCLNPIEFIFHDSCSVDIIDSKGFILWFSFDSGAVADFSFPSSTYMNGASYISSYCFSDSIQGISGVYYTVNITNADTVFFCTFQEKNSSVIVDNPFLFGCGFNLSSSQFHVEGIYNDTLYSPLYADFNGSSSINLINTKVFTWNFYPMDSSQLYITHSIFGEIVTYDSAKAIIANSICDGHGIKVGAYNHSEIFAYNSKFIRGTYFYPRPILILKNYSFSAFYDCQVTGNFVVGDYAKLYLSNTVHDQMPSLYNAAYVLDVFLDSIQDSYINSSLAITGTLNEYKTILSPEDITAYEIGYSNPDSTNYISLGNIPFSQPIIDDTIYLWNTNGFSPGNYLFWITAFVNSDSAISANRLVFLDEMTEIQSPNLEDFIFTPAPNPFHDCTTFLISGPSDSFYSVELYDVCGKFIHEFHETEKGKITICRSSLSSGIYFYKLYNGHDHPVSGKLITE